MKKEIFVFDIDATILFSDVNEDGLYIMTGCNNEMVNKINRAYTKGHFIVLHTGRHWNHLKDTIKQLDLHGVRYHSLWMGKPPGYIVDDKAMKPEEFLEMDI